MITGPATASFVIAAAAVLASPTRAIGQSKSIDEVWALEERVWKLAAAGDVENYLTFFGDGFVGWPCGYAKPATKTTVGNWVREIRDSKVKPIYDLRLEAANDFGSGVVLIFSFADTYPDGRPPELPGRYKVAHTWLKVGGTWSAVGGLCGVPEQNTK